MERFVRSTWASARVVPGSACLLLRLVRLAREDEERLRIWKLVRCVLVLTGETGAGGGAPAGVTAGDVEFAAGSACPCSFPFSCGAKYPFTGSVDSTDDRPASSSFDLSEFVSMARTENAGTGTSSSFFLWVGTALLGCGLLVPGREQKNERLQWEGRLKETWTVWKCSIPKCYQSDKTDTTGIFYGTRMVNRY